MSMKFRELKSQEKAPVAVSHLLAYLLLDFGRFVFTQWEASLGTTECICRILLYCFSCCLRFQIHGVTYQSLPFSSRPHRAERILTPPYTPSHPGPLRCCRQRFNCLVDILFIDFGLFLFSVIRNSSARHSHVSVFL